MTDIKKIEKLLNTFGIPYGKPKMNMVSVGDVLVSFDFIFNEDGSLNKIEMSDEGVV